MGDLIVIAGPNDSGKSRWAEELLARYHGPKRYIATMLPRTEDNFARIAKHRAQRSGLGFQTLELPEHLDAASVPADAAVLLEDVSNLLANAMFGSGGDSESVLQEIDSLRCRCRILAAVTISGLTEADYSGETANYIRALNVLNQSLTDRADAAVLMEAGEAHILKGAPAAILARGRAEP